MPFVLVPRTTSLRVAIVIGSVLCCVLWSVSAQADDTGLDELIARMDRLWAQRDAPGAMQDLVTLGTLALAMEPQNYEAQWRVCQATFWVARTQPNRFVKKAMAVRAKDLSERAIALAPGRAEGYYCNAVALGEYATTSGIMRAVTEGLVGKIESSALKAYELNRDFENGAPMAVIGRFYFMLPWPKRDLPRSRQFLEELRERHPKNLQGRYYLASTYHALGEAEAARRELDYVIRHEGPPTNDPDAPNVLAEVALRDWFADRGEEKPED